MIDRSITTWTLVTLLTVCSCPVQADQDLVNRIAKDLNIQYDVINNFEDPGVTFSGRLTLRNAGSEAIDTGPWQLYFCHTRLMEPSTIRGSVTGVALGDSGLTVYHVNGCLHRIEPTATFAGINPGVSLEVPFSAQYWEVAKTDVMPNWYITEPGAEPRVVRSTAGESLDFVGDFNTAQKWKRIEKDTYNPYTAEDRFTMRDYADKGEAQSPVLPTPVSSALGTDTTVRIDTGDWVVWPDSAELEWEANFLAEMLEVTVVDDVPASHFIHLRVNASIDEKSEYYILLLSEERITITGTDAAGVLHGIQSLLALTSGSPELPTGTISDYPRFVYRGMHIDVGRNFFPKEDVLQMLDVMSMYKLNKLHLHLTDDEGWRLEIPGLPELTTVGATRCHDPTGDLCIMPQLGSVPGWTSPEYYTTENYREILAYANHRHIEVIPEFDMPGHAHAAIQAMLARYRTHKDTNETAAMEYLLIDLDDQSVYESVQYFTDNAINPCVEGTYTFVDHIIREIVSLHEGIQPLTTFHFGGDEVPEGAWVNSSVCWSQGLVGGEAVKEEFVTQVAQLASDYDLDLAGWEDGYTKSASELYSIDHLPNDNVYSYVWNNVWEWGSGQRAYQYANGDYKVILCHATHLYYDHPVEPDPEERGYYWATRFTPARKTFDYMPESVYDNMDVDRMGNVLDREDICTNFGCEPLLPNKTNNVIGMQGQLWSETVRDSDQLAGMVFPRLLALAERAWHRAEWEGEVDSAQRNAQRTRDWERFANTLGYRELARLDEMGVKYALSPPGARVSADGKLSVKSEFPGLPVQYSYDNGQTWADHSPDRVLEPGKILVITRSADRGRTSRVVELTVPTRDDNNNTGGARAVGCTGTLLTLALISGILGIYGR